MTLIILILIFILVSTYIYYSNLKKQDEKIKRLPEIDNTNCNETIQNSIFIQSMDYADKKQDSRTDAIIKELSAIHFWVMILGIYALVKLIEIILMLSAGYQITELIKMFFNPT